MIICNLQVGIVVRFILKEALESFSRSGMGARISHFWVPGELGAADLGTPFEHPGIQKHVRKTTDSGGETKIFLQVSIFELQLWGAG